MTGLFSWFRSRRPKPITRDELACAVLEDLAYHGGTAMRALIERAAEKRGWTTAQVAMALHKEEEPK